MSFKSRRGAGKPAFTDGPHQIKTAPRSVVLIAGDYVGGTSFEAEATMNTSEKFVFLTSNGIGKQNAHGSVHEENTSEPGAVATGYERNSLLPWSLPTINGL